MRVHQLNSCLSFGDAITHHTFEIDRILKDWGFETHIFSEIIDYNSIPKKVNFPENVEYDKNYKKYADNENDLLLFHYSIYCENIRLYKESNNKKIFEYHNITPAEYIKGYDSHLENMCRIGRNELVRLSKCDIALGDSEFNRLELVERGFREDKTDVLPIFLFLNDFNSVDLNENLMEQFDDDFVNILFVGRIVPNKKIEDVIKSFYCYNKSINKKSRLFLVGALFLERYNSELAALIDRLNLNKNVIFTDRIPFSDLKTYYELSNVFLCMSEHEGFGVPLIESMHFKIPIIAYNSTAVPYTLGNAGILINEKNFIEIAEMINIIVDDKALRTRIVKKEIERLREFDRKNVKKKLKEIIEGVIK